jgi:hypothetical protein
MFGLFVYFSGTDLRDEGRHIRQCGVVQCVSGQGHMTIGVEYGLLSMSDVNITDCAAPWTAAIDSGSAKALERANHLIIARCQGDYCIQFGHPDAGLTIESSLFVNNSVRDSVIRVLMMALINSGFFGNKVVDLSGDRVFIENCSFDVSEPPDSRFSQSGRNLWDANPPALTIDVAAIAPKCIPMPTSLLEDSLAHTLSSWPGLSHFFAKTSPAECFAPRNGSPIAALSRFMEETTFVEPTVFPSSSAIFTSLEFIQETTFVEPTVFPSSSAIFTSLAFIQETTFVESAALLEISSATDSLLAARQMVGQSEHRFIAWVIVPLALIVLGFVVGLVILHRKVKAQESTSSTKTNDGTDARGLPSWVCPSADGPQTGPKDGTITEPDPAEIEIGDLE